MTTLDAKALEEAIARAVQLNEPILPDDYPIYGNYLYVADGKVVRSDWHGVTARFFKAREGIKVLRRCDMAGRGLL